MEACKFALTFLIVLAGAQLNAAQLMSFRKSSASIQQESMQAQINRVLETTLGSEPAVQSRMAQVRKWIEPIFSTMPKNRRGRVSTTVMRHSVHKYFAERHGWIVKGFEPQIVKGEDITSKDASILLDKVPEFVTSVLEKRLEREGFALMDVVTVASVVEQLITNGESQMVQIAIEQQNLENPEAMSHQALLDTMYSYFTLELFAGVTTNETEHKEAMANLEEVYPYWEVTKEFISDLVYNLEYTRRDAVNPFRNATFGFLDAAGIAQQISEDFGVWSNHECREMRDLLLPLDPYSRGRVKLSDFYRGLAEDGSWQFHESSEYLRTLGALDETSVALGPQVIIPNYIQGMSNCITSTVYYSVCCINECNELFRDLAESIHASEAEPALILSTIADISSSTTQARNVSEALANRLLQIAEMHGGKVPIHGRLFAQWMHFVFPRDCPYPHKAGTYNPLPQFQAEETGIEKEVSVDEIKELVASGPAQHAISMQAGESAWDLEEELLPANTESDRPGFHEEVLILFRAMTAIGLFASMTVYVLQRAAKLTPVQGTKRGTSYSETFEVGRVTKY